MADADIDLDAVCRCRVGVSHVMNHSCITWPQIISGRNWPTWRAILVPLIFFTFWFPDTSLLYYITYRLARNHPWIPESSLIVQMRTKSNEGLPDTPTYDIVIIPRGSISIQINCAAWPIVRICGALWPSLSLMVRYSLGTLYLNDPSLHCEWANVTYWDWQTEIQISQTFLPFLEFIIWTTRQFENRYDDAGVCTEKLLRI